MLKPGNHFLSPRSPSNNNGKGKKTGSSRPKSNRGQNGGAKGNVNTKGKSAKSSNSNLFSMILDDGKNEIQRDPKDDNNEDVSMENATMQDNKEGTKKQNEKLKNKFSHKMYENAALIYAYFKGELTVSMIPSFIDEYQKRRAYSIAFAAKRCKKIFYFGFFNP